MKLKALKRVGRTQNLINENEVVEGTWEDIYNRLNGCFINGCMIERVKDTNNFKVYAGYGSHVSDVEITGTKEEIKKVFG